VNPTDKLLQQGKALVRAIEALDTIEPTGPIERVQAWFLIKAYKCWLRVIVASDPPALPTPCTNTAWRPCHVAQHRPVSPQRNP
jgi:hypothetical protein